MISSERRRIDLIIREVRTSQQMLDNAERTWADWMRDQPYIEKMSALADYIERLREETFVYVIVDQGLVGAGHNVTAEVASLAGPNVYSAEVLFPAFTSRDLAEDFLSATDTTHLYKIRKLELRNEP